MAKKYFNVEGACNPEEHYMINLDQRILEIKALVDHKKYFSIHRGRQYGKTTTLDLLQEKLREKYCVFYLSFEGLPEDVYQCERTFCQTFAGLLYDTVVYKETQGIAAQAAEALERMSRPDAEDASFRTLSNLITGVCQTSEYPVVLMIDEVDQAGGYPVFLSFLGMLRNKYQRQRTRPTFWSVILAGVYDIRNLRMKIRPEEAHEKNSPWNIAAKFTVDMRFSRDEIEGMLKEYEQDRQTGMDTAELAGLIYDYTSGYPVLVSSVCKIMDEELTGCETFEDIHLVWEKRGFLEAVKRFLAEKEPLFDSLAGKLQEYPKLREMLYAMLFTGNRVLFNPDNSVIDIAAMFGFVKNDQGVLAVDNRIFEMRLYNLFLSEEEVNNQLFAAGTMDKNQFVQNGMLNMELVLKKFLVHWGDLYRSADEKFVEDYGRKFFLLYLTPIINGTGNYYIESRTRDHRRTDIIVDYRGRQYIIEIKIWRGEEYNRRGEAQLADYLESYHVKRGYLLSFNFNKNKVTGAKEIVCGDKEILEVVV